MSFCLPWCWQAISSHKKYTRKRRHVTRTFTLRTPLLPRDSKIVKCGVKQRTPLDALFVATGSFMVWKHHRRIQRFICKLLSGFRIRLNYFTQQQRQPQDVCILLYLRWSFTRLTPYRNVIGCGCLFCTWTGFQGVQRRHQNPFLKCIFPQQTMRSYALLKNTWFLRLVKSMLISAPM